MKRTLLKRKTPLKRKVGLKRKPMKIKPKRFPISKEELAKVDERAGGKCEFHFCGSYNERFCNANTFNEKLEYAHIIHRGMGGVQGDKARIINDRRNITKVCKAIHDAIDGRKKYPKPLVEDIIGILKYKIGWFSWHEENKGVINR